MNNLFSTSWTPQNPINSYDPPYYVQVNNVDQWQELENVNKNYKGSVSYTSKEKNDDFPITHINWVSVSSSESWGSGVPLNGNNMHLKENVSFDILVDKKPEEDKELEEENLTWTSTTFQNNIRLPELVPKGVNIEEELTKQNLYKTELCKSWIDGGSCRYGEKCQFAHGPEELRPIYRHPKYKTEICKTFSTYGTCPYGKRCRFVHYTHGENPQSPTIDENPPSPTIDENPPPPTKELKKKSRKKTKVPKEKEHIETVAKKTLPEKLSEIERNEPEKETESKKKGSEKVSEISDQKKIEKESESIAKKNGSRLPFFQKLHKQSKW